MALWTPEYINTALWLDAADSSTITLVSGAVSQWTDKSGNGRHAIQATAGYRPGFNATTFNGAPALTFNGSSSGLVLPEFLNQPDLAIFLAGQSSNTSAVGEFFIDYGSIGNKNIQLRQSTADGLYFQVRDSASVVLSAAQAANQNNMVVGARLSGTTITLDRNGTKTTAQNASYQPTTWEGANAPPFIGAYNALSLPDLVLNGKVAEFIVLLGAVTDDDLNKLIGYLAHKWGLAANLPADHPYKTTAPTVPSISGTIIGADGNPAARTVRAYSRSTGALIRETTSDASTGFYDLGFVTDDEIYRIVLADEGALYNDIIDRVIPG